MHSEVYTHVHTHIHTYRPHAGQSPVSPEGHRGGNLGTDADAKRARVSMRQVVLQNLSRCL